MTSATETMSVLYERLKLPPRKRERERDNLYREIISVNYGEENHFPVNSAIMTIISHVHVVAVVSGANLE